MLVLPVVFGLAGIGYMLWSEMSANNYSGGVSLSAHAWLFVLMLLCCIAIKDYCGMYRMRVMAGQPLRLGQLFRIRMLYEFTNAATPSAAGGATLEMLFIHREGVKVSRATAMTVLSLFMDELMLVALFPILIFTIGYDTLFSLNGAFSASSASIFWIGYAVKLVWTSILFVGLFVKPQAIAYLIGWTVSVKPLRRWKFRALRTAVEIKYCSREFRQQPARFWTKMLASTAGVWCFKFLIANAAIMIFNSLTFADNLVVFARQYLIAIICMITPTPGGSGFAEVMFSSYLGPYIQQSMSIVVIASVWRLATYYYYLIAGVIILPRWIKKKQ